MKFKNLFLLAALGLMASATLTSCEDVLGEWSRPAPAVVTPSAIAVTSITLDAEATINVGETKTLTATVAPDNATDKTVSWNSDNETVATVADGVVTAVAAGTATITATANDGSGVKATCTVTVKIPGLLAGKFTINSSGKQVQFSQGNLQATYDGSAWTWAFAENQWDYIGDAEGNTKVSESTPFVAGFSATSTTVDLFGWVGSSSTFTGVAQYGINKANSGYGTSTSEALKSDWGTLAISNGGNTANSGWRTLTKDEWTYLFNTRTVNGGTGSGKSYTLGQNVNGKLGLVIYPDDYTGAAYTTGSDWSEFESAGCVFLPAAGLRNGTTVGNAGSGGYYWSSSPHDSNVVKAYDVLFDSGNLSPADNLDRYFGCSVRLVRDVAE